MAGAAIGLAWGIAAITGCKVGPDYQPPMVNAPEHFANAGSAEFAKTSRAHDASGPEERWWAGLQDEKLNELVDRASKGNLDLKLAQSRIVEAMLERGVIAADALPSVDVSGTYTRTRRSEEVNRFAGSQIQNDWRAGFDASWEIDLWGRVARGIEASEAEIDSAVESRRDAMVTLLSEVARNYVELRGFQQRAEIASRNIKLQQETLELTDARFNAGLTSEVDVAQARSLLSTTQSTIPTLDAGVRRAIHRLSVLLGQQPTALAAELETPSRIPVPPESIAVGLPSELLRRRPDVRRAERELAAATARVGVSTADLFPRFSLTGAFGFQSKTVQKIDEPGARFWSFGPAVRWPIFQGGRVRYNIAVQNARVDQALTVFEQACLTSFEDVENALTDYTREQSRMASLSQAVAANRRAFDLATQLYSNGLSDFLRVLDSQRALFASEDALIDSERGVTSNLIALYKALGGGWNHLESLEANTPASVDVGVPSPGETPARSSPDGDTSILEAARVD